MAITTFDTHKYVRRLENAGMPLELAEVQAEVLTEAFQVNLEDLVTKEYFETRLDARLEAQSARLEAKFDIRFAEVDGKFRLLYWANGIIVAAVLFPLLERLAAL